MSKLPVVIVTVDARERDRLSDLLIAQARQRRLTYPIPCRHATKPLYGLEIEAKTTGEKHTMWKRYNLLGAAGAALIAGAVALGPAAAQYKVPQPAAR